MRREAVKWEMDRSEDREGEGGRQEAVVAEWPESGYIFRDGKLRRVFGRR